MDAKPSLATLDANFASQLEPLGPAPTLDLILAASRGAAACLTSSFQVEDMVVTHFLKNRIPNIPVL